jgi:acyl-CoA thioester hydrolase
VPGNCPTPSVSDALGFTREFKERTGTASFAANLSIAYRREVQAGVDLRVESRIIAYDTKRIHSWHELVLHDDTIAAAGELLGLNISTATRRVADMPSEALARLEELFAEHEQLPKPDGVSRSISLDT